MHELKKLYKFVDSNFPTLLKGEIVEIKPNSVSVKIYLKNDELIFPSSLVISSSEFSFVPEVGTLVVVGFIDKKFENPVVLGSLNGFKKDEININNNIIIDKLNKKLSIQNETTSLKDILDGTLEDIMKFGALISDIIPNTLDEDLSKRLVEISNLFN